MLDNTFCIADSPSSRSESTLGMSERAGSRAQLCEGVDDTILKRAVTHDCPSIAKPKRAREGCTECAGAVQGFPPASRRFSERGETRGRWRSGCDRSRLPDSLTSRWLKVPPTSFHILLPPTGGTVSRFTMMMRFPLRIRHRQILASLATASRSFPRIPPFLPLLSLSIFLFLCGHCSDNRS